MSDELRLSLQRSESPHAYPPLQRFNSLGSEKSTRISYTAASADAYNQYAVVSALIFGFAVNSFTNVAGIVADSDQYTSSAAKQYADARAGGSILMLVFCSLLAIVCALSGYATVFMTLQFYACKILLERAHPDRLRDFLRLTWRPRQLARHATWTAMSAYLSALAVLSFEILPAMPAAIVASLMGLGAAAVVVVWLYLVVVLHGQLRTGTGRRQSTESSPLRRRSSARIVRILTEEGNEDDDEEWGMPLPMRVDDF